VVVISERGGIPELDAYEELASGELIPLWLPGRGVEWRA
jgi:hypothetical protein